MPEPTMIIDKKIVQYVANLARIDLGEKELGKFAHQLNDIIGFIDALAQADTERATPAGHIPTKQNALRGDELRGSLKPDEALRNAPSPEGTFFGVPKIIE